MEQNSAKVFSENWSTYQKIMQYNYMHHAEFAQQTAKAFTGFSGNGISVLEIGCGDATGILNTLRKTDLASYIGYDLSANVLQLAATNLKDEKFFTELRQGDMLELIENEKKSFNIIYSSFAVHHLHDDGKQKLLQECYEKLIPAGKMIYIDVFTPTNRAEYIAQYFSFIQKDWVLLSPREQRLVNEHINEFDFPSTKNDMTKWSEEIGFEIENIFQPDQLHGMMILEKPS